MDSKAELENIEKQIQVIKNNSEYQRLLTSHRGIRDDQRFKAFTLQLQTLNMRKEKLSIDRESKYTPNGRIVSSVKKPIAQPGIIANHTKDNSKAIPVPVNHLKKAVSSLANTKPAVPKGRTKPKQDHRPQGAKLNDIRMKEKTLQPDPEKIEEPKKNVSTSSRTISRPPPPTPKPAPILMIKPTRTSIKPTKIPVSKLPEYKAAQRARTIRKLPTPPENFTAKPVEIPKRTPRAAHKDNIQNIDDLDLNTIDQLLGEELDDFQPEEPEMDEEYEDDI